MKCTWMSWTLVATLATAWLGVASSADGQSIAVSAKRYGKQTSRCSTYWPDQRDDCKRMVFGEIWVPNPANVKNIVFLTSGYQLSDTDNALTGQPQDYRCSLGWSGTATCSKTLWLHSNSLALRVYRSGLFSSADTAFIFGFDNQLSPLMGDGASDDIVEGWTNYVLSYVSNPAQLEHLVMGGSSQGGRLAVRLARELFNRGHRIPTTILGLDMTLRKPDQDELTTNYSLDYFVYNPLHSSWKGRILFPLSAFGHVAPYIRIHQVVGGQEVAGVSGVHGTAGLRSNFTYDSGGRFYSDYGDPVEVWRVSDIWEHQWVPLPHTTIGRELDDDRVVDRTVVPTYGYLLQSLYEFDGKSCGVADKDLCRAAGGNACYRSNSAGPICWFDESTSTSCASEPGNWVTPYSKFAFYHPDALPAGKAACIIQTSGL